MAWPTSADVLRTLPFDSYEETSGKLVAADVDRMIATWKGKLAPGVPEASLRSTDTGEDAVSRGARADALEHLATSGYYARDQLDVIRSAKSIRDEAYRLLAQYRQEIDVPEDGGDTVRGEFVENFTDAPLFVGGEYNPRSRSGDPWEGGYGW